MGGKETLFSLNKGLMFTSNATVAMSEKNVVTHSVYCVSQAPFCVIIVSKNTNV